tara:strand:- start:1858 stop:2229 length:372 start_codon:yes stop_codon:yes gene_type:complete
MSSYNHVVLVGNLVRDPDVRDLPSGQTVCDMRIAVNTQRKETEETLFIDVTTWGSTAKTCAKYMSKGRSIIAAGRLKTDEWEDKEGNRRSKTYVVANTIQFNDKKSETAESASTGSESEEQPF